MRVSIRSNPEFLNCEGVCGVCETKVILELTDANKIISCRKGYTNSTVFTVKCPNCNFNIECSSPKKRE